MKCVLVLTTLDSLSIEGHDSMDDAVARVTDLLGFQADAGGLPGAEVHSSMADVDFDSDDTSIRVRRFLWASGSAVIIPIEARIEEPND